MQTHKITFHLSTEWIFEFEPDKTVLLNLIWTIFIHVKQSVFAINNFPALPFPQEGMSVNIVVSLPAYSSICLQSFPMARETNGMRYSTES